MICTQCKSSNPDSARFCQNCGKALTVVCTHCRASVTPGANFCPTCGKPLSQPAPAASPVQPAEVTRDWGEAFSRYLPKEFAAKLQAARLSQNVEGERRIVTILFCDVKGSTAMAESLDPEEWTEIMNEAFAYLIQPVYRYEGTLARLMGDAILAFFGAPVAHEDDPLRAVLAGQGIVEGIRAFREKQRQERGLDFNVRVGINTGLVVVGEVGSDLRVEYTAMGDAVNLAARMEQTAEPGSVQVTASTYKLAKPFFEFEALGGIEVKGKTEPVPAYRLIRKRTEAKPARGIEGLHSPLVGRDRELSALLACLEALSGGRGGIVSLIGEAGLGKSRLVAELRSLADASPANLAWYEGRCLSYDASTPFVPFIDLFRKLFELRTEANGAGAYAEIRARVEALFQGRSSEVAPFLAALLGIQPTGEDNERVRYLEPPQLRESIFQAVTATVERLAASPTLLVFEDIHWIDATSLDLLERLLPLTERTSLMLIALFRPRRQEPSWHFHQLAGQEFTHLYTPISLEPLGESEARQLVANLFEIEDLPEKVRALILKKADGNPFFVEEVIRSLLDQKLVVRDELQPSHWRATREVEDISVPDTLSGVITARLDRLEEGSRRILQTAAVIGREFSYAALHSLHGTSQNLDAALDDLQGRELIREVNRMPQGEQRAYLFKHALTQETAYHSLLMRKRRELHGRFAEYLEGSDPGRVNDIARHFIEARQTGRALPYLVQAGDLAARAYSAPEAIAAYRQALEILSPKGVPARMGEAQIARRAYEGLGRLLSLRNDASGAAEHYQAMLRYAQAIEDVPMQVSALNKLSDVTAIQLGQFPQAELTLADAERLAHQHNDLPGLAEHYMVRCGMCTATANFDGAVHYLSQAVQIGRELNQQEPLAFGLTHIANTQMFMARFEDAWKTAQEGLQISEALDHREHKAEILVGPVTAYHLCRGDLEAAFQAAQEGVSLGAQIGSIFIQTRGLWMLGEIARLRGDYESAIRFYQNGVQIGEPLDGYMPLHNVMLWSGLGTAYMEVSPELSERVREAHTRALNLMEHPAGFMAGAVAWTELGWCVMAFGDPVRAREFFHKGLDIPTPLMLLQRPRLLLGLAKLAREAGDADGAVEYTAQARAFVEERGMRHYQPGVGLAEAQLLAMSGERSLTEAALQQLAPVESLAREMGMRPLALQVQVEAAQALSRLGRSVEAEEKRRQARAALEEIGAGFEDEEMRRMYLQRDL